jgi:sugar (pentulose or hexulose) kinase
MEDKLVITFDFGTQSVRCMIINQKGEILAQDKEKYTPAYYSTKIGYAEQSFEKYYEYACIA